jgi:hypothetical protein
MKRARIITRSCLQALVLSLVLLGVCGCHSIGPRMIPHDRFDYSAALADSWKSMMLLNIVKTRYLDLPVFLEVGQVVSGYTLETSGSLGGTLASRPATDSLTLGGAARFSQQPTITYTPLTGEKFLEGFVNPVPPERLFSLVQAGYAADLILQLSLESLNGLRNQPLTLGSEYPADPEFFRVLKLFRELQDARAVGFRIERGADGQPATIFFFRSESLGPKVEAKITEAKQLLGLPPDQKTFRLIKSPLRGGAGELSVDTRSIWRILASLSLGVEVPPRHREKKLAPPVAPALPAEALLLRVHSNWAKPSGAYAAVPYEGQWFWIANDDWISKRTFTSILFLFTLSDSSAPLNLPTLTIPTR